MTTTPDYTGAVLGGEAESRDPSVEPEGEAADLDSADERDAEDGEERQSPADFRSGRGCLPWPRSVEDGTPLGLDLEIYHSDARKITLSRWSAGGNACTLLDGDDVVSNVFECILRRNRMPSAFDPRKAKFTTYIYLVAGNVISHMLEARARHEGHEVPLVGYDSDSEEDAFYQIPAPEPDPDLAPFDPENIPLDPEEREDFFKKLLYVELTGEPWVEPEPLWKRALKAREAAQKAERKVAERRAVHQRSPAVVREKARALAAEVLDFIRAESAARAPVRKADLSGMLGISDSTTGRILVGLMDAGDIELRGWGRHAGYWAFPVAEPAIDALAIEPSPEAAPSESDVPPVAPAEEEPLVTEPEAPAAPVVDDELLPVESAAPVEPPAAPPLAPVTLAGVLEEMIHGSPPAPRSPPSTSTRRTLGGIYSLVFHRERVNDVRMVSLRVPTGLLLSAVVSS